MVSFLQQDVGGAPILHSEAGVFGLALLGALAADEALALLGLAAEHEATEGLAAGDLCNIWSSGGAAKVRKADATDATKPAHCFCTAATISGADAPLRFPGQIVSGLSGLTPGASYWLDTTAGGVTDTAPATTGNGVQQVGIALSATTLLFQPQGMIEL